MVTINLFSGLAPLVQLVLVIGVFAIAFLAACSRVAASNLVAFCCLTDNIRFSAMISVAKWLSRCLTTGTSVKLSRHIMCRVSLTSHFAHVQNEDCRISC
jgi:hypothetical protein